jgi:hypothetical protein
MTTIRTSWRSAVLLLRCSPRVYRQQRAFAQDPRFKEIGAPADPYSMSANHAVAGGGGTAPRWSGPLGRLPRPSGIRNGGLLLILVALAAFMALVDQPPGRPGRVLRLPGALQHLPPPVGIQQLPPAGAGRPPAVEQPAPGAGRLAGQPDGVRVAAARRHPRRLHPRPAGPGASAARRAGSASRPRDGRAGTSPSPPAGSPPPAAATPSARVQTPPVDVRVTPPRVGGRDLPAVRARAPQATVELPSAAPPVTVPARPRPG